MGEQQLRFTPNWMHAENKKEIQICADITKHIYCRQFFLNYILQTTSLHSSLFRQPPYWLIKITKKQKNQYLILMLLSGDQ